ncbi:hypothetical protein J6590_061728 [Homalodisca vitripennis]|nr:hypothetical protein J6590_061728 [Homalodisca vitripennis]
MPLAISVSSGGISRTSDEKRTFLEVVTESGLMIPDRYWGSYRPGNYFGLKTREFHSPVVGLMWYFPNRVGPDGISIRHWCEQGDRLDRYTWTKHDGRSFGIQEIDDGPVRITTSFIKRAGGSNGGDWTARISVSHLFLFRISMFMFLKGSVSAGSKHGCQLLGSKLIDNR